MINFSVLTGFAWDEGNLTKSWEKHRVNRSECEEVFLNVPLLLHVDHKHSGQEDRFYLLGQTNSGRALFISFTIRETKVRVISARPMGRKERRTYAQTNT